ncbi:MAG: hypothetical protein FJX77_05580 [Armatimonadetes bacterium]|nr:hypothetical protein [Armatimonadota bacterium]
MGAIAWASLLLGRTVPGWAGGGKAEPRPISFAKGKSSGTVSGTLSAGVQHEYSFGARKGQRATLTIESQPHGKYSAFRLLHRPTGYATRLDVNYTWSDTLPADGEYEVTVFLRPTEKVRTARYRLTLTLR